MKYGLIAFFLIQKKGLTWYNEIILIESQIRIRRISAIRIRYITLHRITVSNFISR